MRYQDCFYGSVTVGERGQIVIPADARSDMGIQPGDKVLVMKHPAMEGLMMFKIEHVREFLDMFQASLERAEAQKEDA